MNPHYITIASPIELDYTPVSLHDSYKQEATVKTFTVPVPTNLLMYVEQDFALDANKYHLEFAWQGKKYVTDSFVVGNEFIMQISHQQLMQLVRVGITKNFAACFEEKFRNGMRYWFEAYGWPQSQKYPQNGSPDEVFNPPPVDDKDSSVPSASLKLPGMQYRIKSDPCGCNRIGSQLWSYIQHLNDSKVHGPKGNKFEKIWTREEIADWLDKLHDSGEVNLEFDTEPIEEIDFDKLKEAMKEWGANLDDITVNMNTMAESMGTTIESIKAVVEKLKEIENDNED